MQFCSKVFEFSSDGKYLATKIPEDAFDIPSTMSNFQPLLHVLDRTGLLVNEFVADLHSLQTALRILHREQLKTETHQSILRGLNDCAERAWTLLMELDAICPPRRDAIKDEATPSEMPGNV